MNNVVCKIAGKEFAGWTSVSISADVLAISRSFRMAASRLRTASNVFDMGIHSGDLVEIFIGQDRVLTGYIVKVSADYSSTGINVSIEGFSKTADLLASALPSNAPKTYKNMLIQDILKSVSAELGIETYVQVDLKDKDTVNFSPEETIGNKLIDLLKRKSFLLTDDEFGRLVVCKAGSAGKTTDSLETGKNLLTAKRELDSKNLFQE